MDIFLSHTASRTTCNECGYEGDAQDFSESFGDPVCPDCGSTDVFAKADTYLNNLRHYLGFHEYTVHTEVDHFRSAKKPTRKRSVLGKLSSQFLDFASLVALRQLFRSYRRKVRKAPGSTILRMADFLYSPTTVEKIFKQEVSDWRLEYFEALNDDRPWKARWISCRHYWAIAKAVGLDRLVSLFDRVLRRI